MATVDPGYADWLKSPALYSTAANSAAAAFGSDYVDSEIISPFALKTDGDAEAARQIAFLGGPLARDTHIVGGLRADLVGRLITVTGDRLGYDAGRLCFVIEAREDNERSLTVLTVLTRLNP